MNMEKRLKKLHTFMREHGLAGMIINKPENRRYFSGFTGSAGLLLISLKSQQLFTDFRYKEQATLQAGQYEVVQYTNNPYELLGKSAASTGLAKVGFESDFTTYDMYRKIAATLPQTKLEPVQIDWLRMTKDSAELLLIKKAVAIADQAFSAVLSVLQPGISEQGVALELEYQMRKLGAEKPAFDTIIASGIRGALPHGKASDKIIEVGDLVTMDFGAVYQGYHSDITRTVSIGQANPKQREIYNIVLAAQLAGVQAVQPGKMGMDVDAVSRKIITDAGYGNYFGHGLGHGVGLAIHEEPRLSQANTTTSLAEDMVVTIEPGIYLPNWGGVRIEDTVLVSATGCEVLTASSKKLIEINYK